MERRDAAQADLLATATEAVLEVPGVRLVGSAQNKASVLSFVVENIHPHDIGTILDTEGIAVRAGHHCAQPVMQRYSIPATTRASIAFYNTREECETFAENLECIIDLDEYQMMASFND